MAVGAGCATAGHGAPDDLDAAATDADVDAVAPAVRAPGAIGVNLFSYPCDGGAVQVDPSPMRRISRVEYDDMVRDLLLDTTQPATAFPPESPLTAGVSFQANTYTSASDLIVQDYAQAAEALAETATASPASLAILLPCRTSDVACAQQFIEKWTNRAFRGQLDATSEASLVRLYTDTSTQFDFPTGIQAVIEAVLESPRFLYVVEPVAADAGAVVPLSSYEIAARLALFLWRSVPDDTLMQAAHDGLLATADQVRAQATRMIADARATGALADFATQWMQLQSTPTLGKDTQFKAWNNANDPKLGQELVDETIANVTEAFDGGTLTDLLTSPSSYIDQDLANFYAHVEAGVEAGAPLGAGPHRDGRRHHDQRPDVRAHRAPAPRGHPHQRERPRHQRAHDAPVGGPARQARSRAGPVRRHPRSPAEHPPDRRRPSRTEARRGRCSKPTSTSSPA